MVDLSYREVRPDDLEDMHEIVSDWSVVRQLGGWPWPPERSFTETRSRPFTGDGFVWAICDRDRLIGTMAVTRGELGYFLKPERHGEGIAKTAMFSAITEAFDTLGCSQLRASTWFDNAASHGLLKSAGFEHFQTHYQWAKARKLPVLVRQYRLSRAAWDRLKQADQWTKRHMLAFRKSVS